MEKLSDSDRSFLEKKKWQLEFASSIIDVCCSICGGPLFFYKVFVCGHLFCDECTKQYGESKIRINCPIDNNVLSVARWYFRLLPLSDTGFQATGTNFIVHVPIEAFDKRIFKNHQQYELIYYYQIKPEKLILIERTIYNLRVGCIYRNKGCKEISLLGEALGHYKRCEFRDLIKQLEITTEVNLRKLHKINVPKFLQDDFGASGLAAPYSKASRRGNVVQDCLDEDEENEPEVLMHDDVIHAQSHTCHFRIHNFAAKMKKLQSRTSVLVSSEFFDVDDQPDIQIMAKISFTKERVDVFLDLKVMEDAPVNTLNNYKRVVMLVDQSDNEIKHHVIRFEEPGFGAMSKQPIIKKWMAEVDGAFQPIPMALVSKADSVYVKNDELYFKIIFTPMVVLCARPCNVLDGILTWDIPSYSERKHNVIQGVVQCLRSQYFYCHNGKGYRMQASLYFHQLPHRNQTYLSVHMDFLKGRNDENLTELFSHQTTFVVYQKNDPNECIEKVVRNEEGHLFGDRIDDFVSANQVENGFLDNDTLSMKILVKPLNKTDRHSGSSQIKHKYFSVKLS